MWTHSLLHELMKKSSTDTPYGYGLVPLPRDTRIRVAVRRMMRVGSSTGIPLEDYGVTPDDFHDMKKEDLMEGNKLLIKKAIELLSAN